MEIKNGRSSASSGWVLRWTFTNGQTITQLWQGIASQNGAQVEVRDES